jgi:hypothetical protein
MTVTTHTVSFQIGGKDIMAFQGERHDDGTTFIDVHGPGYTVRAEWSTKAAQASADGTEVKVSVNGGATESVTVSNGVLMGSAGPWQPALGLVGDGAGVVPEVGDSPSPGEIGQSVGQTVGGAIGQAVGGNVGGAIGQLVGGAIGRAVGALIGNLLTPKAQ